MNTAEIRKQTKSDIKGKHFKAGIIFLLYTIITVSVSLIPLVGSIFILIMSVPLGYGLVTSMIKLKRDENVGYFDFIGTSFNSFSDAWRVTFSMLGKIWPYLLGYFIGIIFMFVAIMAGSFTFVFSMNGYNSATLLLITAIIFVISLIILLVFGILLTLKSLYYSLINYILYDNSSMKGKDIVEKSHSLMKGHRWHLIKMQIPYYLLYYLFAFILSFVATLLGASPNNSWIFSLLTCIPMIYFMPLIQFAILNFYDKLLNSETQEN